MSGNYFKLITDFNSDKEIIALREKYKEPTFFEIISKNLRSLKSSLSREAKIHIVRF